MNHKVLVLGSRGYIGRNLIRLLESKAEVHFHLRGEATVVETLARVTPSVIINASASGVNDGFEDSINANFLYQLDFLKQLKTLEAKVIWVQLSSYYELQIPFGRDDFYTKNKSYLRQILYDLNEKGCLELRNVFLPHVFGLDEKTSRLIPSIKRVRQVGASVDFSKGMQFVPILHVEDACRAIWGAIHSEAIDASAAPIWYGRIQELVELLLDPSDRKFVVFNESRIEVDNSFPKVNFPKPVSEWIARYLIEDLKNEF